MICVWLSLKFVMVCRECEKVTYVVRNVIMIGRWPDDKSVNVPHVIDGAKLGVQKVMSGDVRLKFVWFGMHVIVCVAKYVQLSTSAFCSPLCDVLVGIPVSVWH